MRWPPYWPDWISTCLVGTCFALFQFARHMQAPSCAKCAFTMLSTTHIRGAQEPLPRVRRGMPEEGFVFGAAGRLLRHHGPREVHYHITQLRAFAAVL